MSEEVTIIEVKPRVFTVSVSRKVPRDGGFGAGEEVSLFIPVEFEAGASLDDQEVAIKGAAAFAKAFVYDQLGLTYGLDETGVVRAVEADPIQQTAKPRGRKPAAAKAADGEPSKEDLWDLLASNYDDWFDNRATKTGNQPDFKLKKQTAEKMGYAAGRAPGLWLESAPDSFDRDAFEAAHGAVV